MPIGEAHKSGSSFTGLAEYILAQGIYKFQNSDKKPEIVFRNHLFSSTYLELGSEFRDIAKDNSRVTKPVMHLTVNFKETDHISNDTQKKFVRRIMDEMGVREDNHQFLVVKHNDKHPHYHIQVNRIGFDGKTLSDSNSKLRIGTACDKIEKEMGLDNYLQKTRAFVYDEEAKTYIKNINREINNGLTVVKTSRNRQVGIQEKKDYIQIETLKILDNHEVNSLEILQAELKKRSIGFQFSTNKKEQVSVSFEYDGLAVKGSQISLKGSLIKNQLLSNQKASNQLEKKLEHLELLKQIHPSFIKSIDQIVQSYNSGTIFNLKAIFDRNGISDNHDSNANHKGFVEAVRLIKQFDLECKEKLEKAKSQYTDDLRDYQRLQKTELKKGFLGILSSEQNRFNDDLKNRLNNSKKPVLEVVLEVEEIKNQIHQSILKSYSEVNSQKVIQYVLYSIDENIKIAINNSLKIEEKKRETANDMKNNKQSLTSDSKNPNDTKISQIRNENVEGTVRMKMRRKL